MSSQEVPALYFLGLVILLPLLLMGTIQIIVLGVLSAQFKVISNTLHDINTYLSVMIAIKMPPTALTPSIEMEKAIGGTAEEKPGDQAEG